MLLVSGPSAKCCIKTGGKELPKGSPSVNYFLGERWDSFSRQLGLEFYTNCYRNCLEID